MSLWKHLNPSLSRPLTLCMCLVVCPDAGGRDQELEQTIVSLQQGWWTPAPGGDREPAGCWPVSGNLSLLLASVLFPLGWASWTICLWQSVAGQWASRVTSDKEVMCSPHWFVCQQDYIKSTDPICIKLYGGSTTNGSDLNHLLRNKHIFLWVSVRYHKFLLNTSRKSKLLCNLNSSDRIKPFTFPHV